MSRRCALALLLCRCVALAVIIDRIAVVVGSSIVKQSDIEIDLRVTEFLNNQPLDLSLAKQKEAASRLIDQVFIRKEIQVGSYPVATLQEADAQIERLVKQRYKTQAAFRQALSRYGLTELELRTHFQWQLTVLKFIDDRFKPAVLVNDDEIEAYYHQHAAALRGQHPGESLDQLRARIRDILTAEGVNKEFFAWLDQARSDAKIQYLEASLK